jgi:hypothetical protein
MGDDEDATSQTDVADTDLSAHSTEVQEQDLSETAPTMTQQQILQRKKSAEGEEEEDSATWARTVSTGTISSSKNRQRKKSPKIPKRVVIKAVELRKHSVYGIGKCCN